MLVSDQPRRSSDAILSAHVLMGGDVTTFRNDLQRPPVTELRYCPEMLPGDRIKQAREAQGISRKSLARMVRMPYSTLAELEQGAIESSSKLPQLAAVLKLNPVWLATGKGAPDVAAPPQVGFTWADGSESHGRLQTAIERAHAAGTLTPPAADAIARVIDCLSHTPTVREIEGERVDSGFDTKLLQNSVEIATKVFSNKQVTPNAAALAAAVGFVYRKLQTGVARADAVKLVTERLREISHSTTPQKAER